MQQSFMHILLAEAAVKAVCWTLVHSLWQGLVAALVAGAVILTTRKSAAVLRYNLLTADLVLFLVATVATFSYELRVDAAGGGSKPSGNVVIDGVRVAGEKMDIHARYETPVPSVVARVGLFLNEHAGVVVMVWMGCLLVQLFRMTGGLYKMHQMRHRRVLFTYRGLAGEDVGVDGAAGNKKESRVAGIGFGDDAGDLWIPEAFHFGAVGDAGEPAGRAGGDDPVA